MRQSMVMVTMLLALMAAAVGSVFGEGNTQPAAEQFVLSGVVVLDGGRGIAWLYEPTLTRDQVIAVRPGESVGPYRLTRVLDDRVEMEGPGGKVFVPLYSAGPGSPSTAVASGPSSQPPSAPAVKPERAAASGAVGIALSPLANLLQPGRDREPPFKKERAEPSGPLASSPFASFVPSSSTIPQAASLQHLEGAREGLESMRTSPPPPSVSTGPGGTVYRKGDPRLRGAFQSLFGGK